MANLPEEAVGAGALDSPFGGGNAVIVITLMPIYFRGALLRYVPIIQWVKKYRDIENAVPYTT